MMNETVKEARERFKLAKEYYSKARSQATADTKFVMGDSDNKWQWPDDVSDSREQLKKVCLTVNLTAQHCNQIINNIRLNRPAVKVSPVDSGADKKTAEILGGLIRNIQVSSQADGAHDTAAEHAVYGGEGYWRVVTEFESPESFDQVILIKPCTNPNLVYIDPNAQALDKSDAEWGFIFEDVPIAEIKREHKGVDPESWEDDDSEWSTEETIRRAEYFWCEYVKETACLMPDGSTGYKSKLPEEFHSEIVKERPTWRKKWQWCKLVGGHDEPLDQTEWLGSYLPIISVVGKEVNVDGELVRKGIVRDLKDSARMVNFAYSETVQTLALQNKVPYLAPAESIEGYEDYWQSANIDNATYLPYNAYDDKGQPLPAPSRQQPAVMPTAQIQLLQMSVEQMRGASGQQNANFGIKSEAASGVGIQRLKAQGEMATFHFPDNLARALTYEAKVLIDLIQQYYDTERVVRILGLDGQENKVRLKPDMAEPYQEMKDDHGDIQQIFNPQVGRYDVTIDTGPSYHTQRQETAANLTALIQAQPALMQVAGDLFMQAQDFPLADKFAERLAKTIPPELQDDKEGEQPQIPPQIQQQIQQMQQAIQQMQGENQRLKQDLESKELELQTKVNIEGSKLHLKRQEIKLDALIAQYEAETKRMAAMKENITPGQIERLVVQTMQEIVNTPPMNNEPGL